MKNQVKIKICKRCGIHYTGMRRDHNCDLVLKKLVDGAKKIEREYINGKRKKI